ncbi:MAG: plasmid pRiA4b ORF-3 family protein [Saprospiraceae bacterium]|nr:plasmid pRiA4b ORF-3 family protein [Saprospiraceae bacterium]
MLDRPERKKSSSPTTSATTDSTTSCWKKILDPEPGAAYPRCTAGARACPPEHCSGPWGYEAFLEAINDPKHPEHESMLEWVGGEFDAEEFEVEEVNERLGRGGQVKSSKPDQNGKYRHKKTSGSN